MINNNSISEFSDKLVKDIVLNIPGSAEVFEKYGIDFCCGGNRTLQSACDKKGINTESVGSELSRASVNNDETMRFDSWELDFLAQYIVNNHHGYVKLAVPRIMKELEKINAVHGAHHPFLSDVKMNFEMLSRELISHMRKEEEVLFKMISILVESKRYNRKPDIGKKVISGPINMMESEHDNAGNLAEKIRELTDNYTLPEDACTTFALTYKDLQAFERDLHKHVFLENNILFPRAVELENELFGN